MDLLGAGMTSVTRFANHYPTDAEALSNNPCTHLQPTLRGKSKFSFSFVDGSEVEFKLPSEHTVSVLRFRTNMHDRGAQRHAGAQVRHLQVGVGPHGVYPAPQLRPEGVHRRFKARTDVAQRLVRLSLPAKEAVREHGWTAHIPREGGAFQHWACNTGICRLQQVMQQGATVCLGVCNRRQS